MKFTPGQVRETLQLSQATYRHWKRTLAPLEGRNGYAPCFTPGDLLAIAIVKALTEDAGLHVGSLQKVAAELFNHCGQASWAGLERLALVIEPMTPQVTSIPETNSLPLRRLAIVLPYRPIITTLRERLLMEQLDVPQGTLRFPPTALVSNHGWGDAS
jgi:hypothetical protein